ncbi:MAG: class I SAM-dependent methyltransferase [Chloroflexota bacterium]
MTTDSERQPAYKTVYSSRDFISDQVFAIQVDPQTGLARTADVPDDLTPYYGEDYYGELEAEGRRFIPVLEAFITRFREARMRMLLQFHPAAGRVLDVGCGRAIMLGQLKARGWEALGTEIAPELAEAAHRRGINVFIQPDLRDCGFVEGSFDAVTMWHTLEHIANPSETLAEVYRILKPGGIVLIEVPNMDSWQAVMTRGQWFHLDVPRHYWHYSTRTLLRELTSHGFEVVHTRTFSLEYGFYGYLQSLLNLFTLSPNFLYSLLRRRYAAVTARPVPAVWDIAVTVLLMPVLLPLSIILEGVAVIFFQCGSVIRVVARKPE